MLSELTCTIKLGTDIVNLPLQAFLS